jgi:hypothetical protein
MKPDHGGRSHGTILALRVITGLKREARLRADNPVIHHFRKMDTRVKPAYDVVVVAPAAIPKAAYALPLESLRV